MRGLYFAFALFSVRAAAQTAEYSAEARLAGLEGTVQLIATIAPDGTPSNLFVTQPLGLGLDQKALDAAAKWRFTPEAGRGPKIRIRIDFLLPEKQSRWHLIGVSFEPPEGASRPEFLFVTYPRGSGIVLGADDTAIDEARIVAAAGRQAWADVSFDIDENGFPRNLEAPQASVEVWKHQAIALVRDWRFTPGMKEGKPVVVRCTLHLVWGERDLSAAQLAKARVEDMPVPRPPPARATEVPFQFPLTEFPPTPGVARIRLLPSEAIERLTQNVTSQQTGILGVVLFNVLIGTDGHVQQATAIDPTSPYVAEAARAVKQWIYRPLIVNGVSAEVVTIAPVAVPAK
jgi:TonB family protein